MTIKNLTVRGKLTLAFGGLAALLLLVAGVSVKSLGDANEQFVSYVQGVNARSLEAAKVRAAVDRRAIAARDIVLASKPEEVASLKAAAVKAHEDVQQSLNALNKMVADAGNLPESVRKMVSEIGRIEAAYTPVALGIVDLASSGKREEATVKINTECRPLLAALIKATDEYQSVTEGRAAELTAESAAEYATHRNLLIAACLIALAAAVAAPRSHLSRPARRRGPRLRRQRSHGGSSSGSLADRSAGLSVHRHERHYRRRRQGTTTHDFCFLPRGCARILGKARDLCDASRDDSGRSDSRTRARR